MGIQRLILIFFIEATTVLDIITTVATMATPTTAMARGLLMPRLPLLLTPRPTPTWCIATTVLVATTVATMAATPTMATTARDLPTLSPLLPPLLMPRLIPGTDTTVDLLTTATATHTTDMATATATTGASKKGTSNPELASMKCQHFRRRPA